MPVGRQRQGLRGRLAVLSRRGLLRGAGAAVAAAAGLGGGLVAVSLLPPAHRDPRAPLRVLTPRAFSVLSAVADRICPGSDGLPSAWDLEVPEGLDLLLDRLHPGVGAEIIQALLFLENPVAGTFLDGRMARFTQSSPDVQDEALRAFGRSSLGVRRQAYQALSGLISATYWSNPATWAHVGYPGPPRFPEADPGIPWAQLPARRVEPAASEAPAAEPEEGG